MSWEDSIALAIGPRYPGHILARRPAAPADALILERRRYPVSAKYPAAPPPKKPSAE